mmetsp:Transcript_177504/g.569303  ORF Transcript_177504/g.569303 Transcript_177504/m.569303 type:complete len:267 (-) Transcript_177504:318-1118(-)
MPWRGRAAATQLRAGRSRGLVYLLPEGHILRPRLSTRARSRFRRRLLHPPCYVCTGRGNHASHPGSGRRVRGKLRGRPRGPRRLLSAARRGAQGHRGEVALGVVEDRPLLGRLPQPRILLQVVGLLPNAAVFLRPRYADRLQGPRHADKLLLVLRRRVPQVLLNKGHAIAVDDALAQALGHALRKGLPAAKVPLVAGPQPLSVGHATVRKASLELAIVVLVDCRPTFFVGQDGPAMPSELGLMHGARVAAGRGPGRGGGRRGRKEL